MPISIDFLANVSKFLRGTDDIDQALEDVSDSLEDVAKDGDRATERLERSFADLAREAKDAGRDIERGIGDGTSDGARKATRGLSDVKDEAADTGREMAASFKEPADALDAIQELSANALSGLGPAGVLAGGAAAVGLGLVTTALQTQQEEADKLKEALAGAYREAAEEQRTFLDNAQITAGVNDILFDPSKQSVYEQAKRDAETLGVTLNDVLRAQAGDQDKINLLIEAGTQKAVAMRDAQWGTVDANVRTAAELGGTIDRYNTLAQLGKENQDRAERALGIEQEMGEEERSNIQRAQDADAARWGQARIDIENARKAATQPATMPVTVNVSTAEAERRLAELTNRAYEIEIGVRYRNGKEVLQ